MNSQTAHIIADLFTIISKEENFVSPILYNYLYLYSQKTDDKNSANIQILSL
jgi:hypothetical protein